ncbi:hypothetical protein J3A83DRAFT_4368154 [Scleroderma citrinum]
MVGEHSRDIPLGGAAQSEEEEPECNDVEHDAEMSGGLQDWQDGLSASDQLPVDVMSIDGQTEFRDDGPASQLPKPIPLSKKF